MVSIITNYIINLAVYLSSLTNTHSQNFVIYDTVSNNNTTNTGTNQVTLLQLLNTFRATINISTYHITANHTSFSIMRHRICNAVSG